MTQVVGIDLPDIWEFVMNQAFGEFSLTLAIGVMAIYFAPYLFRSEIMAKKMEVEQGQEQEQEEQEQHSEEQEEISADAALDAEIDALMEGSKLKFYAELPCIQAERRGFYPVEAVSEGEFVADAIDWVA